MTAAFRSVFTVWCSVRPGSGAHAFLDLLGRRPDSNRMEILRTVNSSTRHGRPVRLVEGVGFRQAQLAARAAPKWARHVKIVEDGTEPDWPGLRACEQHHVYHTRGGGCDVCLGQHAP